MNAEFTSDDRAWLAKCHIQAEASEGPCDHDHCPGCSCACHYADAYIRRELEDAEEITFDQAIIRRQRETLQLASRNLAEQKARGDRWRNWALAFAVCLLLRFVLLLGWFSPASILWGR